jgi:hypothetical protein
MLVWNVETAHGAPVRTGKARQRRQNVIEHAFDALTRSLGRRRAVQALAAAATVTLSGVTLVGAKSNNGNKNKNKKQKKKIQKKALALCANQVTECQALVGGDAAQVICCQELADCDFAGLVACLSAP